LKRAAISDAVRPRWESQIITRDDLQFGIGGRLGKDVSGT
jgi:hypothetical protein